MGEKDSNISVLWNRVSGSDKPLPAEPACVLRFPSPNKEARDPKVVLKNVADCCTVWARLGFDRIELDVETMDTNRPGGLIGGVLSTGQQNGAPSGLTQISGFCLNIRGFRPPYHQAEELGRLRVYDFEAFCQDRRRFYGLIGDLNGPLDSWGQDLLEQLKALAVFNCDLQNIIPMFVLQRKTEAGTNQQCDVQAACGSPALQELAEHLFVEIPSESDLRKYKGLAHTIRSRGGIVTASPAGQADVLIRLAPHLSKLLHKFL